MCCVIILLARLYIISDKTTWRVSQCQSMESLWRVVLIALRNIKVEIIHKMKGNFQVTLVVLLVFRVNQVFFEIKSNKHWICLSIVWLVIEIAILQWTPRSIGCERISFTFGWWLAGFWDRTAISIHSASLFQIWFQQTFQWAINTVNDSLFAVLSLILQVISINNRFILCSHGYCLTVADVCWVPLFFHRLSETSENNKFSISSKSSHSQEVNDWIVHDAWFGEQGSTYRKPKHIAR